MRPGTGAYPLRGHNNVQGASDHGSMPNMLPGYQLGRRSRGAGALRGGLERAAADHQGPGQSRDGRGHSRGKLKAMYVDRRGDGHRRLQRELRRRGALEAGVPGDPGHLLQPHVPVRRRGAAGDAEPGEGRHVHQHRAADPAALPGLRADAGNPAGLADHPGRRQSARRRLELPASVRGLSGDRVGDAALRRRDLRAARRISIAAVAGRGRRTEDQPLLYARAVPLPGRQGAAVPARVDGASRSRSTPSSICT